MFSMNRFGRSRTPAFAALATTAAFTAFTATNAGLAAQQAPPSIQYGPLTIHGCELREARFDPPFHTFQKDGTAVLHESGWQIVIRGADFPVRALDPILWVDDVKLENFERHELAGEQELAFDVIDPKLLRAEHSLQVIYGNDERTRTKLSDRLDPEKLVKLPDAQRKALGIPELEGLQLQSVDASGRIAGRAKLSEGSVRLAARSQDGTLQLLAAKVAIGADGTFRVDAGALPAGTTQLLALLVPDGVELAAAIKALPKGVEVLDRKPVAAKASNR